MLVVVGLAAPMALPTSPAHGQDASQEIVVDLGDRTGAFRGAANGVLYGLSDDGVPSDNALEPLKIATVAQKPPGGAQHPNGDALNVAHMFLRTGGEYIQIYVQDMYEQWPYEDLGFDDYMDKLAHVVDQVVDSPYADRMVYVPFNEPDFIWYGLSTPDDNLYQQRMATYLEHWRTAVEYIREHHPGARVMGMNDATFRARNYGDFLTFARDNFVLPDIVSWHQLPSDSLDPNDDNYYRSRYQTYRRLEAERGIDPLPININEHAGNRDLTVPGQMVQFVSMFEETKVDAGGQAYWTAAGGLAGNVVQTNKPGGSWWFYKMYADMNGGDTVRVTPPERTSVDALEGFAAIDDHKRQARIVAGGTREDFDVVIDNIDNDLFGDSVHVTLAYTTWSGQDADAPPPTILHEADHTPANGSLTVPIRGTGVDGDGGVNHARLAAYEIVLSPGGAGAREPVILPWRGSYEAENATITDGSTQTLGTAQDWNTAATSGNAHVRFLNQASSAVTFDVDVPETGDYRLSILYANQTGNPAQQVLTVNGEQGQFVDYPATLHWEYRSRKDVTVALTQGTNQIRLGTSHPQVGTAVGEATLDRIDLEQITNPAPPTRRYEAERAQSSGDVAYDYDHRQQSGAGFVTLKRGAEILFAVYAEEDGYYDLEFRHSSAGRPGSAAGQVSLDRRPVDGGVLRAARGKRFWDLNSHRLFLSAGLHRVTVEPARRTPLLLDRLSVTRASAQPVQSFEAEDATMAGTAVVEANEHASGGSYVEGIGEGAENRLTLTIDVEHAGDYVLMVRYANNDRDVGHPYNADIISRPVDFSVNGRDSTRHWFKNTWSWGNFWTRGVPVRLKAGTNSIALFNDPANAVTMDVNWAPHLDRFELAPVRVR